MGGDRKRARFEQQCQCQASADQGLEQELESLATFCDYVRLTFPPWRQTPYREMILDLVELIQSSNSLADVREILRGRVTHGSQFELHSQEKDKEEQ